MEDELERRCAIYTRFSSDLQRDASLADQERLCRERIEREGWTVAAGCVIADRAISGASVAGRDGFSRLIQTAKQKPRPFDSLVVYDTSRLARDLPDLLRHIDILKFHGVNVVSVV